MARYRPGIDRKTCLLCKHRNDMHVSRDGATICVVCDRATPQGPCVGFATIGGPG
jgi:hypothetical protein